MRQVLPDLWETATDNPFPGLTTHAYLWTSDRNALFYSVASDAEFADLEKLGGVDDQYLSHHDEAGPMLGRIEDRFGATLHAPAPEVGRIGRYARVDIALAERYVDDNGVEVIPTPGHTPGSTCYLVPGDDGLRYLFTGDTLYLGESGEWTAGYLPSFSNAHTLAESLRLLATLTVDVVISSAYAGDSAVNHVVAQEWPDHIDQALTGLSAAQR
ncbi:MBL fold metallo-hydrolase [Gordonia amicalis]|uniref:MBL fold metallo-hydrolase n=1 Tax=Gordonia amicalis TaxID=89053 RepID=UPI0022B4ABA0|nr:MBL fold metallo-hydrolase [Gordonia amicalis]MCZ4652353.1 MBL fold metallo-hydrolase [Gordonia amicalis]